MMADEEGLVEVVFRLDEVGLSLLERCIAEKVAALISDQVVLEAEVKHHTEQLAIANSNIEQVQAELALLADFSKQLGG